MTTKARIVDLDAPRPDLPAALSVGQVADLFGITVRTLHHYDQIGLLAPSDRSRAGYRLYTHEDLVRLQQIVVYRRLEFPLDQIACLLADGDRAGHLLRQRAAVRARVDELGALVAALDDALEREMSNRPATTEELTALFGDGFDDDYAAEAQQRWGDTEAWRQSSERTSRYTKADWEQVKAEGAAVQAAFAAAFDAGLSAGSEAAMDAAELHRASIERFYDCSTAMHRALGDMYLADPRFTATYEAQRTGMAQYVRDAIHANADRRDG